MRTIPIVTITTAALFRTLHIIAIRTDENYSYNNYNHCVSIQNSSYNSYKN